MKQRKWRPYSQLLTALRIPFVSWITERLIARKGTDWWNIAVPWKIKTAVQKLKEKENATRYHTPRSNCSNRLYHVRESGPDYHSELR